MCSDSVDTNALKRSALFSFLLAMLIGLPALVLLGGDSMLGLLLLALFFLFLSFELWARAFSGGSSGGKIRSVRRDFLLSFFVLTIAYIVSTARVGSAYNHDPHLTTTWANLMVLEADEYYKANGMCLAAIGQKTNALHEVTTPTGRWIYRVNDSRTECSVGFLHEDPDDLASEQLYSIIWSSQKRT